MFIGYKTPFLIPSRFTLLIEINSCLFDAGTLIFPLIKVIYDRTGVPLELAFWAYAAVAIVCFSLFALAWCLNEPELEALRNASKGDEGEDVNADEDGLDRQPLHR